MLANRTVQPHYAEHLVRAALEHANFESNRRDPFAQAQLRWPGMYLIPDAPQPIDETPTPDAPVEESEE